jgi:hypothetical protein
MREDKHAAYDPKPQFNPGMFEMFDTHRAIKRLEKEGGLSEKAAVSIVDMFSENIRRDMSSLATKVEVADIKVKIAEIKATMATKQDVAHLKEIMATKEDMHKMRADMHKMGADMHKMYADMLKAVAAMLAVAVGCLGALMKFMPAIERMFQ